MIRRLLRWGWWVVCLTAGLYMLAIALSILVTRGPGGP